MSTSKKRMMGKYELIKEVGRGSMGVVYAGYDPYIDRAVAVKVALADALNETQTGERFRKMFFNEAHTAGMLRHPNILEIFDAGVDDDKCYIVMELVPSGDTLRSYCRPDTLLPVKQVVDIIFKCAKALDYAHRQGVIHRDIKPSNILLTDDNEVKIADFSIAHITQADLTQTMPMGFVGSPRYMSPEQVQEDEITSQTDLFSLGIVAYEMLTGRHPFGGETFSSLIHKVINEPPIPMSQYLHNVPEGLERIINRVLEKAPERRYRAGIDLASDLSVVFSHLERPQEDISAKERFVSVKKLEFFREFSDTEIWEIIRSSVWQDVKIGEVIIEEGDIDDSFFVIASGTVAISKRGHLIEKLSEGGCFGEMSHLRKTKRSASVIADSPVTVMRITSSLIEQVSKDCQLRFLKVFLDVLVDRLQKTTDMLARD